MLYIVICFFISLLSINPAKLGLLTCNLEAIASISRDRYVAATRLHAAR